MTEILIDYLQRQKIRADFKNFLYIAFKYINLPSPTEIQYDMTISYYTIIEIKADFVKVGCHKIPTENIKALFNQMNNQQQEAA